MSFDLDLVCFLAEAKFWYQMCHIPPHFTILNYIQNIIFSNSSYKIAQICTNSGYKASGDSTNKIFLKMKTWW